MSESIFFDGQQDNPEGFASFLESEIRAPYVSAVVSRLGGKDRPSVFVRVSLDPQESWSNHIFQNSKHFQLYVLHDGEIGWTSGSGVKGRSGMMEHTALTKRFRKTQVVPDGSGNPWQKVATKINSYIREAS